MKETQYIPELFIHATIKVRDCAKMLFSYQKKKTCVASYFLYLTKTSWNNLAMCLCMRMIN